MAKLKYEVVRPWSGVTAGQVVEFEEGKLHPALKANVRLIRANDSDDAGATETAAELVKAATLQAEAIIGAAHVEAEAIIGAAHVEAEAIKAAATKK